MATKKELEVSFLNHCREKNIPKRPCGTKWKNTIIYRCEFCQTQLTVGEERCPHCNQKYEWVRGEKNDRTRNS